MSGGSLPPVPGLIPISALRKTTPADGVGLREVMGEQRPPRRAANHPADELIDSAGSRGASAAPLSRKARSQHRHRKSDRRRDRHKHAATPRSSRRSKPPREEFAPPIPPRVNPIFVWVRQEDTLIVDVKCEDYDKRNRILLTKTAQGWRAIPRTETLALKEADRERNVHHHRSKKSRKGKVRRRSTGVQVTSDIEQDEEPPPEELPPPEETTEDRVPTDEPSEEVPPWMSADNVNVESLLPSHTIQVKRSTSPRPSSSSPEHGANVNSAVSDDAQTPTSKCSADKLCDVSPLDNLLAVAELEFNHQIETGEWSKPENAAPMVSFEETDEDKEFMKNLEQLNELIESEEVKLDIPADFDTEHAKTEECDYTEEDDNNLAMDDILSRLEQSLRSPECTELANCDSSFQTKKLDYTSDSENLKSVPDLEDFLKESEQETVDLKPVFETPKPETEVTNVVESSTKDFEEPTDLSMKLDEAQLPESNCEEPTDLSVPKTCPSPRPPSQNSEAIQSPQPSGIPAVPPSPDIVSTTVSAKSKSAFLESLLTNSAKKIALNSEVTITRQREPLDLGKCRKSASPTVTCSEEANSSAADEPPAKKIRTGNITLKNLLNAHAQNAQSDPKGETPRLIELLKNNPEPDPLTQLKQLMSDTSVDIPDPMLVPKDQFSSILTRPGVEIPRLLRERPELRLPEALAYPHIMQDPNMLVLNVHHLESILSSKSAQDSEESSKSSCENSPDKPAKKTIDTTPEPTKKKSDAPKPKVSTEVQTKAFNELANDIDAATQAAFSQMAWLPYLNHLEAMSLTNNAEIMKMFTNSVPPFPMYQAPDFSQILAGNRPPVPPMGFPMQQPPMTYTNPWEMNMWQEAMVQANMLRSKASLENFNNEQMFKSYLEKMNPQPKKPSGAGHRGNSANKHQRNPNQRNMGDHPAYQNPYMPAYQKQQQPQFGTGLHQRRQHQTNSFMQKSMGGFPHQKLDSNQNFTGLYPQGTELERHQYRHNLGMSQQEQFHQNLATLQRKEPQRPKVSCKPFANISHPKEKSHSFQSDSSCAKQSGSQPIDLSGAMASGGKLKVKQHLVDPAKAPKLLKQHDDVPEVGSTTASIEEMQDAHKHLWHPLFGNQKGYTSPWNWTTVTATGE